MAEFERVKERLDQIVELVSQDDLPIDEALSLYEEAVKLGLEASSLLEQQILAADETDSIESSDDAASDSAATETDHENAAE